MTRKVISVLIKHSFLYQSLVVFDVFLDLLWMFVFMVSIAGMQFPGLDLIGVYFQLDAWLSFAILVAIAIVSYVNGHLLLLKLNFSTIRILESLYLSNTKISAKSLNILSRIVYQICDLPANILMAIVLLIALSVLSLEFIFFVIWTGVIMIFLSSRFEGGMKTIRDSNFVSVQRLFEANEGDNEIVQKWPLRIGFLRRLLSNRNKFVKFLVAALMMYIFMTVDLVPNLTILLICMMLSLRLYGLVLSITQKKALVTENKRFFEEVL